VLVAAGEDGSLRLGEREEVVVARVGGATSGRFRVGCGPGRLAEKLDEARASSSAMRLRIFV
jgi:hypothetical protein